MAVSYVRLSDRNSLGMVADIVNYGSKWSIAGLDVKPYPKDNPRAKQFVDDLLRLGVLEEAAKAEHEEVRAADQELFDAHVADVELMDKLSKAGVQEGHLQTLVEQHVQAALERRAASRNVAPEEELEPAAVGEVHHQEGGNVVHEPTAEATAAANEEEHADQQGARRRQRPRSG